MTVAELIRLTEGIGNIAESKEKARNAKLNVLGNEQFAFFKGVIAKRIIRS